MKTERAQDVGPQHWPPPQRPKINEPGLGDAPDLDTLMGYMDEGGCEATDGCWVEPDGTCPHGKPSWLIALGMI